MDEILLQTDEEGSANHGWNTDLSSSLWMWGGMLGHNLQFRPDYFSNFFNKVLLNTIQERQIFCFVPMIQYHPQSVVATTGNEAILAATYNANTNNAYYNLGYFPITTGKMLIFLKYFPL